VATSELVNYIREKLHRFLESTMEKGFVADGVVAQDSTQTASFWQIREVS
jgi:D-2-hydroxyglutarate dehydrogenase